ncbi:MAG: TRAP transporter small permease subunit, partial [Pseudomonadota bacterium]
MARQYPSAWTRNNWTTGRDLVPPFMHFGSLLNGVGTVWIVTLMLLICADVVARGFFNQPLPRIPEFVGYSIVAIVFLQLPNTLNLKKLTRADAFINLLMVARPIAGNIYNAAFNFCGLFVMSLIAYGLVPDALESYEFGEYFGQQGEIIIPVWPFKAVMAFCAIITALEFLNQTLRYAFKAWTDEP